MTKNQNPKLRAHHAEDIEFIPVGAVKHEPGDPYGLDETLLTDENGDEWIFQFPYQREQAEDYKDIESWQIRAIEKDGKTIEDFRL